MWVYPLSYRLLGANPTVVQSIVIYCSCLAYAAAMVFLVRSLIPACPLAVTVGAVALALLTTTVDGNLARFGQGNFSLGQYYGFAVALQLVVAALAIRGEIVKSGIGLALLLWIHPMIAAITALVAGATLIVPHLLWKSWPKYLFAFFLVICSAILYMVTMREGVSAGSRMPFDEWVDWVRFSNYHWFPFKLGVFTWENDRLVAPLISIFLLALNGISIRSFPADKVLKWFAAVAASLLLTIVGLLNSISPVSMVLTMASLHRASGLILTLALPLACLALYNAIKNSGFSVVLAVVIFASPFLGSNGFPLLPAVLLFLVTRSSNVSFPRPWRSINKALCFFVSGVAFADSLWLIFGLGASPLAPSLAGSAFAWILGGFCGVINLAARSMRQSKGIAQKMPRYIYATIFFLLITLKVQDIWERHPSINNRRLAEDYFEVQKWARANTPAGSLFMTDPTHCYGWKDYSARPSWGNFRDWIHSPIVYHTNTDLFEEGLRRARKLGVDPAIYLDRAKKLDKLTVTGKPYSDLALSLKSAYYSLNSKTATKLSEAEKIDYFVFEKALAPKLNNKPEFFNESFVVYRVR
jgi:hypothetical protein